MAPQTKVVEQESTQTNSSPIGDENVQVDDKIYSARKLSAIHPGGPLFVKAFAGKDASEAFMTYHRRRFPHSRVSDCLVATAKARKELSEDDDYMELCELVEQVVPKTKSYAPLYYYFKLAFILVGAFGLEFYMHSTGNYKWYLTAPLGFFISLIGLNIQHDANHGAISRVSIVNRILGYTQNWIGGSSIDWIHQHVVQHHIDTNDVHEDPDIGGSAALRLNPLKPLLKFQVFQHVYVFLLLCVFGYMMIFTSLQHVVEGKQYTRYSKLVNPHRVFEIFTSFLFIFRWCVLPYVLRPSFDTFLQILPMFVIGGYYLAFFFIISHNFVGVHMFDRTSTDQKRHTFLYKQVASSCNVGGPYLAFLNGGLNYQIEHHLFPRMQHSHYATVAPIVRAFCAKKGIPYKHFPTIAENLVSCVQHLQLMGSKQRPVIIEN